MTREQACFYDFYDYNKHLGLHTSHFPCLPCCQNPNFLWMAIWPIPEDESWLDYQSEQSISIFLNDGNIYRPLFLLWQIEYKKNLLLWKFVITYKGVLYRENFFVLCLPTWGHLCNDMFRIAADMRHWWRHCQIFEWNKKKCIVCSEWTKL